KLLGVPLPKIISRHLLPNMAEPLLVVATSNFALALLELSSLSFVGLGVQSPEYDYGRLLNEGLVAIYSQPLQVVGPSIMLILAGVGAMLLGDGLAANFDPRGAHRRFLRKKVAKSAQIPAQPAHGLLTVEDLTVRAPNGKVLVEDVSFTIEPGQILGVVGESGSGKSTTAMAVAGLLPDELHYEATTLALDDMDLLAEQKPADLARNIGLVYQDPGTTFNPALKMGKQLTELSVEHQRVSHSEANRAMMDALADIRITRPEVRMKQYPHELSGGMLQRAMIASSTNIQPNLLSADEPATALDVTVQMEVLQGLNEINRTQGTAMLFISHDIGVVQELCDQVLVMQNGRILEQVSGAQLKSGDVQHPYTKMLLSASPSIEEKKDRLIVDRSDLSVDV